jgi:hypothetical protein
VCDRDVYGLGGVSDSGLLIGVDLRQGAQKQAADVGKNGGTTRGDAVLGQELIKVHEGMVYALRGLEELEIPAKVGKVIGGFLFELFGAMLGTENRTWIGDGESATAAAGRAMRRNERIEQRNQRFAVSFWSSKQGG